MQKTTGKLSIHTENLMPIIKRWLYESRDIFIRELVSNACDAVAKHKKLVEMGEAEPGGDYRITLKVDADEKTISFEDNGIGMSAQEAEDYLGKVAFSGAEDFLKQYQQAEDTAIIGHFGLGFYSAFMVAEKVVVDTKRYSGEEAVRWSSDGDSEYTTQASGRTQRGTTVTLHLLDDAAEFLNFYTVREITKNYCGFLPVPIYAVDAQAKTEDDKKAQDEPVNDTRPLWLTPPRECKDEDYKEFYAKAFKAFDEPLFWIHLNVDYPFKLNGILYFPRIKNEYEMMEGVIKLYNNQVFVADNIKEIIPEFMMLLKGVMDFPDLPLNVSRSALQNDGTIKKIQSHITKKVADKLKSLFEGEREKYESYWDDIAPFVRFGCIKDVKFYEAAHEALLYKTIAGKYVTLEEYRAQHPGKLYYASDLEKQAFYIRLFAQQGQDALVLGSVMDQHFIEFMERQDGELSFVRIDSEIADAMKDEGETADAAALEALFREATGKEKLVVRLERLKSEELPAMLLEEEKTRRFGEMAKQYGFAGGVMAQPELLLNAYNPLIKQLESLQGENARLIAAHIYDVALMNNRPLTADEHAAFNQRANQILSILAQSAQG